ncbi:MAG TPA: PliI family lysozyme inhibitor of I-type lysozyme [Burkholderiales bacterium]
MNRPLAAAFFVLAQAPLSAADVERHVESVRLPTSQMAVIAEGDLEPRSIGSYSLRLYSGRKPEFPLDDFITGLIRPRDGTIIRVVLEDVNGDVTPEIVIVMQGAGSGGHLSADAFGYGKSSLYWLESVTGLEPGRNPVQALRTKLLGVPQR